MDIERENERLDLCLLGGGVVGKPGEGVEYGGGGFVNDLGASSAWKSCSGKTLLVSDDPSNLGKPWREIPAPVQIKYNHGNVCRNFSPTVLPTEDGESVIHITTDYEKYIGGPCEAWFGVGPIDGAGAAAPTAQPMDARPGR